MVAEATEIWNRKRTKRSGETWKRKYEDTTKKEGPWVTLWATMQAIQRKWLRENKKIKGRAMSHPKRQKTKEIQRNTMSKTTTTPASRHKHHRHHRQITRARSISIVCVSMIPKQSGGCDKLHLCNLHYREHKRDPRVRSEQVQREQKLCTPLLIIQYIPRL